MIHTLQFLDYKNHIFIYTIIFTIVSISVNIFIIISGYTLLDKEEKSNIFFIKRAKNILPLFLMFHIFYLFYFKENMYESLKGYTYSAGHLWYVYMIIGLYLLTPWLRKVLKYAEKETFFIVILWFLANVLNPFLTLYHYPRIVFSNFPLIGFIGYYLLGYYIKKYKEKCNTIILIIMYIVGFCFCFFGFYYFYKNNYKLNTIFFEKNYIGTFFMSIAFFILFVKIKRKRNKVLTIISDSTFFAYLIHLYFIESVKKITVNFTYITLLVIFSSLISGILFHCIIKIISVNYKKIIRKI